MIQATPMSTERKNIKHFLFIKTKGIVSEFNTVMGVVSLVAKRNKCKQFSTTVKDANLPLINEATPLMAAQTAVEVITVNKYELAIHIIMIAFQAHVKLSCFITEIETLLWPTGEMHEVMINIKYQIL